MSGNDKDSSKKLSDEHDNPIDNILISLSDKLCPLLKSLNFTPNMITFIGLLTGLLAFKYLYLNKPVISFGFFWVSYFMDSLDGHYARKYHMESEYGDYFDHLRDITVYTLIISLLVYRAENKKLTLLIVLVSLALLSPHIGCQESHSEHIDNNKFLQKFKVLCTNKEYIKFTRFFGGGTFTLIISLLILFPL